MRRELRIALIVVTAAAWIAQVADLTAVVRGPLVLLAVLVAPGLAASFSMGPMSTEMRVLVSIASSSALVTLLAVAMMSVGGWSGGVAFLVVAAVTIGCSLHPVRPTTGDHA